MEEPVVSEFSTHYYVSAVIGTLVIVAVCITLICIAFQPPITLDNFIVEMLFCLAFVVVFCFKLYIGFRKITVTNKDIIIHYSLTKKEIVIDYADVDKVYPRRGEVSFKYGLPGQCLVIELNNGEEISFNYQDYDNYNELKAAIYKYKLGIGA